SLEDSIKLNSAKGSGGKRISTSSVPQRAVDRGNYGRQANPGRGSNPRITSNRHTSQSHVNNRIGSKTINQRVGNNDSLINSRLGRGIITKPHVPSKPDNKPKSKQQKLRSSTSPNHSQESPQIRNERKKDKQQPQLQQTQQQLQQEPAKKIVVICNLDPRATAEDVGEACSVFGPILSCDMLLDPMGRPLNEAEIEFVYPDSALECKSRLDNSLADGRLLRAKLQETPTMSVKPRYSSRSVVASARVQPETFETPSAIAQQLPQYPHPNYPSVYSPQPYFPQQHPYSQNHYRRY
ncbi:hypothetical protein, partial, partial [Parasitella parasitica]